MTTFSHFFLSLFHIHKWVVDEDERDYTRRVKSKELVESWVVKGHLILSFTVSVHENNLFRDSVWKYACQWIVNELQLCRHPTFSAVLNDHYTINTTLLENSTLDFLKVQLVCFMSFGIYLPWCVDYCKITVANCEFIFFRVASFGCHFSAIIVFRCFIVNLVAAPYTI